MSQPERDRGDGGHRQVVNGPFLVAGGNPRAVNVHMERLKMSRLPVAVLELHRRDSRAYVAVARCNAAGKVFRALQAVMKRAARGAARIPRVQ